ncbi:hypothetical protein MPSEU_000414400 [Mayamaea pseudoterrestris]|nr:hypothetical protein MPSEU_000414400 [Mayamaea pseudoterrestris]
MFTKAKSSVYIQVNSDLVPGDQNFEMNASVEMQLPTNNEQQHQLLRDDKGKATMVQDAVAPLPDLQQSQTWGESVRKPNGRRSSIKTAMKMENEDDTTVSPRTPFKGRRRVSMNQDIELLLNSLEWEGESNRDAEKANGVIFNKAKPLAIKTEKNSQRAKQSEGVSHSHEGNETRKSDARQQHFRSKSSGAESLEKSHDSSKSGSELTVFPLTLLPHQPPVRLTLDDDDAASRTISTAASKDGSATTKTGRTTAEELALKALTRRRGSIMGGTELPASSSTPIRHGLLYKHLHKVEQEIVPSASFVVNTEDSSTSASLALRQHRRQSSTASHLDTRQKIRAPETTRVELRQHIRNLSLGGASGPKRRERRQGSSKSRLHGSSSTSITYDMEADSPMSVKHIISERRHRRVKSEAGPLHGGVNSMHHHAVLQARRKSGDANVACSRRSVHSEETVKAGHGECIQSDKQDIQTSILTQKVASQGRTQNQGPSRRSLSTPGHRRRSTATEMKSTVEVAKTRATTTKAIMTLVDEQMDEPSTRQWQRDSAQESDVVADKSLRLAEARQRSQSRSARRTSTHRRIESESAMLSQSQRLDMARGRSKSVRNIDDCSQHD